MKRSLLLVVSLAYSVGVALGSVNEYVTEHVQVIALLFLAGGIVYAFLFRSYFAWLWCVVWIGIGLGIFFSSRAVEYYKTLPEQHQVSGIGTMQGEVLLGSFDARIRVKLDKCDTSVCPREVIQVSVDQYGNWEDGARLRIGPCDFKRPDRSHATFDYPMYLAKEGIGFVADTCPVERLIDKEVMIRSWLHQIRVSISRVLETRLPEPEAGLARGLLLGGNDELPKVVAQDFRTVGLSHIVAVSGYNISVLSGIFFLIGIGVGWYRKRAVWIALFGTVLFVFLVGAPASAVRAMLMACTGFAALLVSRPTQALPLLFFVAALMLFHNPLLLRYDIGFQLSFMATFAILISATWRERFSIRAWFFGSILEGAIITSTVLLFVTPITVFQFGTLSPYALLANILALVLTPLAFFFSGMTILFGWIPGIGALLGWLSYGVLHGLIEIASTLAHFPGAHATYTGFQGWMFIPWYVFLVYIFSRQNQLKI